MDKCEVLCPVVDTKLDSVWAAIRTKISMAIFIPTVILILAIGGYMAKQIGGINVSVAKIETQLQLMNGGGGKR